MDQYIHFSNKTKEDILKLIEEYGNSDNMNEAQNESPTVQEFLNLTDHYPDITYHGYIITKPRTDYRVSIEGFQIKDLTADEALDLTRDFRNADDCDASKQENGLYTVFTWWD